MPDGPVWQGRSVKVVAGNGVLLAGSRDGVFRSEDSGESWRESSDGLTIRHVRWLAWHLDGQDTVFAGTEPAAIFVSSDGGLTWTGRAEVEALRDRFGWFLPYSPEAGCVRGFACNGARAYAAVEVGGVLGSDDLGGTWALCGGSSGRPEFEEPPEGQIHPDVHSVTGHPQSSDLVYAATGGGFYHSTDGGLTWNGSRVGTYCRAVWVDPADGDHIVIGHADSVRSMNGRIEESKDGGVTWSQDSQGLDLPWPQRMVERFFEVGDHLWAVTDDGCAYARPLNGGQWRRRLAAVAGIASIAAI